MRSMPARRGCLFVASRTLAPTCRIQASSPSSIGPRSSVARASSSWEASFGPERHASTFGFVSAKR